MTLSFYIARRFGRMFLVVLGGFVALLTFADLVEQIRRFPGIGLGEGLRLALLNMPGALYEILPLVMMLATVGLFVSLARTSELVVARAAGRSALVTLIAPVAVALAIGALAVIVLNPIVAGASKTYALRSGLLKSGDSALSVGREGLWLRQGGAEGQTVIHADRSNTNGTELTGVTFLTFGHDGQPARRIAAEAAVLEPGGWRLTATKEWPLAPGANPERAARTAPELVLATDLTADRIRDSFGAPSTIPIWELPAFIAGLEKAGFSARPHQVWLQMELALPLLMVAMVLIGAGFTMRHARFGRTGLMVLLALGSGLAIFFIRNFAQVLGENGQIPVILAAWSPPIAAIFLSLALLLHLEDG